MDLKLENKETILNLIKKYAINNNIEFLFLIETFYRVITKEIDDSKYLDDVLFEIKNLLKRDNIWEIEEELFHVISYEINNQYTQIVFDNADKKDIEEVYSFLYNNYLEVFKSYYDTKKTISENDYNECVLSVFNNFYLDREVADVLVGKWLEENIII